jgi:hypothetical protein
MIVDFCSHFLYFILNYSCLFFNSTGVGLDTALKNITTSIQKFAEVVVEAKPCEMVFVRSNDKQAQIMVAELSPPMSVENIQLNLKQKINIKGNKIRIVWFDSDCHC